MKIYGRKMEETAASGGTRDIGGGGITGSGMGIGAGGVGGGGNLLHN